MPARDFLRNNLPYAIEKVDGKWIVKNRDYVEIGICHLPDNEIIKAADTKREDDEGNVTAVYLYDDGCAPNFIGKLSRLDEENWKSYCDRLKILITKLPEQKQQKKLSLRR